MKILQIFIFFLIIGCSSADYLNMNEKLFSNLSFRNSEPVLHGKVSEKTILYYQVSYIGSKLKNISRYENKEGSKLFDIEIDNNGKFSRKKVYKYNDGDLFNLIFINIRNPQWVSNVNFGSQKSDFGHGEQCVINCLEKLLIKK